MYDIWQVPAHRHRMLIIKDCKLRHTNLGMCQFGHDMGVQIGLSETSVLKDYHKDALDRYNVTCDFPKVIRELVDPHKRFPFQASLSSLPSLVSFPLFL